MKRMMTSAEIKEALQAGSASLADLEKRVKKIHSKIEAQEQRILKAREGLVKEISELDSEQKKAQKLRKDLTKIAAGMASELMLNWTH